MRPSLSPGLFSTSHQIVCTSNARSISQPYVSFPGQHPFDMFDTAAELDSIANNDYDHPPLVDVSWSWPKLLSPKLFDQLFALGCLMIPLPIVCGDRGLYLVLVLQWDMESMVAFAELVNTWKLFWSQYMCMSPILLYAHELALANSYYVASPCVARHQILCAWFVKGQMALMPNGTGAFGKMQPCTDRLQDCGVRGLTCLRPLIWWPKPWCLFPCEDLWYGLPFTLCFVICLYHQHHFWDLVLMSSHVLWWELTALLLSMCSRVLGFAQSILFWGVWQKWIFKTS